MVQTLQNLSDVSGPFFKLTKQCNYTIQFVKMPESPVTQLDSFILCVTK